MRWYSLLLVCVGLAVSCSLLRLVLMVLLSCVVVCWWCLLLLSLVAVIVDSAVEQRTWRRCVLFAVLWNVLSVAAVNMRCCCCCSFVLPLLF